MNQVLQFEEWIEVAKRLGYHPRYEYFGGTGGGVCRVGDKRWLFIDLANSRLEQLDALIGALVDDPLLDAVPLSDQQRQQISNRANG